MKTKLKSVLFAIGCILLPPAVGALSALLSAMGMAAFDTLLKPPLTPPAIVFPIVWTVLYLLMGVALYRVCRTPKNEARSRALRLFFRQLALNFGWSIVFFTLSAFYAAFVWLIVLWVMILLTMRAFFSLDRAAGWLLLPYLLWVTAAGYLNLGVAILNG